MVRNYDSFCFRQSQSGAVLLEVPSILVASFAMQESGCNPQVEGQGGEQGMMQISQDKVFLVFWP